MTTDPRDGAHPGRESISNDATLRPYSAPQLIRLDTRATALGTGAGPDLALLSGIS